MVNLDKFKRGDTVVTNIRHYDSLLQTRNALMDVINGLDNQVTNDFVAMDIRQSLHYLGENNTRDFLVNLPDFGRYLFEALYWEAYLSDIPPVHATFLTTITIIGNTTLPLFSLAAFTILNPISQ